MALFPSVLAVFPKFSTRFEGFTPYPYLDVRGLVTTGIGNLVDPFALAAMLPWKVDGVRASPATVREEWQRVKDLADKTDAAGIPWVQKGGGAFEPLTSIRLEPADIATLMGAKLASNDAILLQRFPRYHDWPADAQLGLHSMAWAMGPAFVFPKFQAAVNRDPPDFVTAARECYIADNPQRSLLLPPTSNPGLRPRNLANALLFANAAISQRTGRAFASVNWPNALSSPWGPRLAAGLLFLGGAGALAWRYGLLTAVIARLRP